MVRRSKLLKEEKIKKGTKVPRKPKMNITNSQKLEAPVEFDKSKYQIVEKPYPFGLKEVYRCFIGDLGESIKLYEKRYGEITGVIYYDPATRYIAFVSGSSIKEVNYS